MLQRCSVYCMDQLTRDQAERELVAWATANACRDDVIRAAHHAGVTKIRIAEITGIARTTIDRILEGPGARRGLVRVASPEDIAEFLEVFIEDWPRAPEFQFQFRPPPAMAHRFSASDVASQLLETAGFRALHLGSWLSTPNGELIAAGVELLSPPPYDVDIELLVEALKIAATKQRTAELDKALGIGVVAAIAAALFSGSRS